LTWEAAHPGESAFAYERVEADLSAYPYDLVGLAEQLANAHFLSFLTPAESPVQVAELERCPHTLRGEPSGYWGYDPQRRLGCYDQPSSGGHAQGNPVPTTTVYVAWRDAASPSATDLQTLVGAGARAFEGTSGEPVPGSLAAWPLDYRPVVLVPGVNVYLPMIVKVV
jgi:hypothetical protein